MIDKLSPHYSMQSNPTVYDEEALTVLQLVGRTTAKINETVNAFNNLEVETNNHLKKQDDSIPVKIAEKVMEHINDGQFDDQINKYAGDLEKQIYTSEQSLGSRIDNLSRMGEGSTTGDAELTDARVSDMGHTHNNVGSLIRTNLSILRMHGVAECIREKDFYSLFEKKYIDGVVNTTNDCISIHPPVKFDRLTTIRPLPGYEVSCQRYSDAEGKTTNGGYKGWTDEYHLLEPEHYYSICLRHKGGRITLDEGSALLVEEPFYHGVNYGNALDVILPIMRIGGYATDNPNNYTENDKTAMYSKGGFTLSEPAVIHCTGESSVAIHTYDGIVSNTTMIGDSGWSKEITIPANTLSVVYFRASDNRRAVNINDLKTLHYGHSLDFATVKGNINRRYSSSKRKGIAHRGYSNYGEYAPENTIPAFRLAKSVGFDYVECDVRISADDVPVICHDLTVDRTSNGTGYVHQMTVEQLKALDFSMGFVKYAGTKIPTLEETLITCKNLGINIYLEIEPECLEYEPIIVSMVKTYNMENAVSYISFSWDVLFNISKIDNAASLGLIVDKPNTNTVDAVCSLKTGFNDVFLNSGCGGVTDEIITKCKEVSVPLEIWVINDTETMRNTNPYVRGVTSDNINYKTVMYDYEMEGI